MKWLWDWLQCKVWDYHTWVDTNGDGMTDHCMYCNCWIYDSPRNCPNRKRLAKRNQHNGVINV